MINPSIVDLLTKVEDRYSLVTISSKRARQLIDGAQKTVETDAKKPLTIAINEVNEGTITFENGEDPGRSNE
jgi:DNA-directed RNA polymerase subunit omega